MSEAGAAGAATAAAAGPPRLVVIGAGISGLAAAVTAVCAARRALPELEVLVLDREDDVGGRARTWRDDGWLVEAGPGGFLDTDPEVAELVDRAGLAPDMVPANASARRRFVYLGGRLHRVGLNPLPAVRSGLLGPLTPLRVLGEMTVARAEEGVEESVHDFCARRFGSRVAERIVGPAMLGVFAGDARRLSLDSCFPRLRQLEQTHGSVLRGALVGRRRRDRGRSDRPSRRLTSFRHGMHELPAALARHPGMTVRRGVEVVGLRRAERPQGGRYIVSTTTETFGADAVVVATPAGPAARLLADLVPVAATDLARIPSPPVAVVALGYRERDAATLPRGFGMLVARGEGLRTLGSLWESHIYPRRAPAGHVLVRAMLGGRFDPEVTQLDDTELADLAAAELTRAVGVTAAPVFRLVRRWRRAIPQYEIGHAALRQRVHAALDGEPGLQLASDALDGISFVDVARTGIAAGRAAVDALASRRPARRADEASRDGHARRPADAVGSAR